MTEHRQRDWERECTVIQKLLNQPDLDGNEKIYYIQSYLLGWITEEKLPIR